MPAPRSLYQVLGVVSTATDEEIRAAHSSKMAGMESGAAMIDPAERTLVREAFAVLGDPARRATYDQQLRERNLRAMASGVPPPRPSGTQASSGEDASWWKHRAFAAFAVVAAMAGTALVLDHYRKVEALRLERERAEADIRRKADEQRLRDQNAQAMRDSMDWNKARIEKAQQEARERQFDQARQLDWQRHRHEQERQRAIEQNQAAQREAIERQGRLEEQRREQENLRRQREQLERDRRTLRELEQSRGMKF